MFRMSYICGARQFVMTTNKNLFFTKILAKGDHVIIESRGSISRLLAILKSETL